MALGHHHLLPWLCHTMGSPSTADLALLPCPAQLVAGSSSRTAQTPPRAPESAVFPSDFLSDGVTLLPVRSLTSQQQKAIFGFILRQEFKNSFMI